VEIRIQNARSHNLAGVSCRIPLGSLTVVSGVSGSGKSTLAFDTLYAEGQRRYVASLSAYARQFLERLPRPDVDFISNLPPAIAIERRNRVTNARSTVGTATEILDHLRLLFAKIGETWCEDCGRRALPGTVESIADAVILRFGGRRIAIAAPLPPDEPAPALRERLLREGFSRLLAPDGEVFELSDLSARELTRRRKTDWLLIDRLVPRAGESRARLCDAVANALARGAGRCGVFEAAGERAVYREGFACESCGRSFLLPEPALFSFNSPLGACQLCQGFGRTPELDRERVVPYPTRSIDDLAIAPFATPKGLRVLRKLQKACALAGVPTDRPFGELSAGQKDWVFRGDGRHWRGVQGFFQRLERKRYKVSARVMIARYRRFAICDACGGARLRPEALAVRVGGQRIDAVCGSTLAELCRWLAALELTADQRDRAGRLLEDLRVRPDARPRHAHALGRRGAAHPARDGPRRRADGVSLRARRAFDRTARARFSPAGEGADTDPRPGQHGGGGRARSRDRLGGGPRDRPRPARRPPRRAAGLRGKRGGSARTPGLAHRARAARRVPAPHPAAAPPARRAPHRGRPRPQPEGRHGRDPAPPAGGRLRRLGRGQVVADRLRAGGPPDARSRARRVRPHRGRLLAL
jgi:hypothetical protein